MNVIESQYMHLKHFCNNVLFSSHENFNLNHLQKGMMSQINTISSSRKGFNNFLNFANYLSNTPPSTPPTKRTQQMFMKEID